MNRRTVHIGLSAAVLGGLLTSVPSTTAAAAPSAAGTPAGKQKVIVVLDGASALQAPAGAAEDATAAEVKAEKADIAEQQKDFLGRAKSAGVEAKSVRKLGLLVNAVAMTVDADDAEALKKLPGVKSVVPDTRMKVTMADANRLVGNTGVWQREDAEGRKVTGKGVTVAVIDSGVDYSHPDLGGCLGADCKVVGGYDFVNDDADPMDDNGHGTHVGGIVAAKPAAEGGVTGAAPDAKLTAYKAMNADGYGDMSDIIAAIEAAADPANPHRADIINLSIGATGAGIDGTDPVGLAATAAVEAGILVVAAAGNDGAQYAIGSPGSADGVLTVGASTSGTRVPRAALGKDEIQTYPGLLTAYGPDEPATGPVVDLGWGMPEDWERVGDVKGKVVLYASPPGRTEEDGFYPDELAVYEEAEKRGALAVIGGVSSDGGGPAADDNGRARTVEPGEVEPRKGELNAAPTSGTLGTDHWRMDRLPILGVDRLTGYELAALAGTDAEITISSTDSSDRIASFSSRGPSPRLGLEPEIVAPGVEIRSTVPKSLISSGYYRLSGTSMATPLVAGSAALLRQLHPEKSAAQLRDELTGSAQPLADAPVTAQGAGRLDTAAAADATLTASPATLAFGHPDITEDDEVEERRTVTLHNSSKRTLNARVKGDESADVSPSSVRIPAGGSKKVTVEVEADRPAAYQDITGRITVEPDRGPDLTVPYQLTATPVVVEATPDPSDGTATVYAYSQEAFADAPTLTVDPRRGRPYEVKLERLAANAYQAQFTKLAPGTYDLSVEGRTVQGTKTYGEGAFEVTPAGEHSTNWAPIGPNSAGGQLTLAPTAPDQAVVSTGVRGGAWVTTDRGKTWKQRTRLPFDGAKRPPVIVVDKDDAAHWWAAVRSDHPPVGNGGLIMETRDNGLTWQKSSAPDAPYTDLTTDPDQKVLLASAETGQYMLSRDKGRTWQVQELGFPTDYITSVQIGGDDLYGWHGKDIWVVRGWVTGSPKPAEKVYAAASHQVLFGYDANEKLLTVQVQGSSGAGLYASENGGRDWHATGHRPNGTVTLSGAEILHEDGGKLHFSKDAGRTWTSKDKPNRSAVFTDFDRWADGSHTVGSSAGILRGASDGTYTRTGVQGVTVNSLAYADGSLVAGSDSGLYRTGLPAAGPEWGRGEFEGSTGASIGLVESYAKDSSVVWRVLSSQFGGSTVQKSTDGGVTWADRGRLDGTLTTLLIDPDDPDKVTVGYVNRADGGVYVTTDGGAKWRSHNHELYFKSLAQQPGSDRLWLGGTLGLWYSDDGGKTLTKADDRETTALHLDGRRIVAGGQELRYSTDGGKTFRTGDSGGLRMLVSDVVEIDGTYYAGTSSRWEWGFPIGSRGVLKSEDGGRTWQSVARGMQNTDVRAMAADPSGKALYVGTYEGGVQRLTLGG
ncbi:S8 family serine peptidase [Streptomyces indicus]|uniref:S8 family serine peptidase n=1 Tax=Streptomyces indicus TaxID=417292 RepID=UPI0015A26449|nr:S8 family serine peptidase [Streptomyces indicus]